MTASTKQLASELATLVGMGAKPAKPARKPAAALKSVDNSAVSRFSIRAWRSDLITAAKAESSASTKLLDLALAARGMVEKDTAREAFQDAYVAAHLLENPEITDEQARSLASVRNRVSEAMAVFKAVVLPDPMPKNLSRAADACRKLNAKAKPVAVDSDEKLSQEAEDDEAEALNNAKPANSAMDTVMEGLEALQRQAVNNPEALSAISAMMDLASDVLLALLKA